MAKQDKRDTTDMSVWTPITPRSGRGLVHITSLTDPHRTACRLIAAGWMVALSPVSCQTCESIIHFDTRPKRKRKSRKKP